MLFLHKALGRPLLFATALSEVVEQLQAGDPENRGLWQQFVSVSMVEFQGVYDLPGRQVLRFERTAHGAQRAPVQVASLGDPALEGLLGASEGYVAAPVRLAPTFEFTSIVASPVHMCGLAADGQAYCWGANEVGQAGQATGNAIRQPTRAGTFTATSISTGNYHTCAVTTDEQVQCWGRNGSWELGDGTNTSRRTPAPTRPPMPTTSASARTTWTCRRCQCSC